VGSHAGRFLINCQSELPQVLRKAKLYWRGGFLSPRTKAEDEGKVASSLNLDLGQSLIFFQLLVTILGPNGRDCQSRRKPGRDE
jgi:hypothetical protein